MRLIVVDDNSLEREGIKEMLQSFGLNIDVRATFENGQSALEYLKSEKTEIVILDIQMPRLSGIELLRAIRENGIKTNVILVSCYDDFKYAQSAINYGAVGYVLKPVVKSELRDAVEKAIEAIKKAPIDIVLPVSTDEAANYSREMVKTAENRHLSKEELTERVKNIVTARFSSHLSVADIANELFISSKHLNNIFKAVAGKSVFEYLTEYRMEKAKLLLTDKNSKIYAVSEQVGYKRKTHFNDVFKQYTGLKPLEYKNLHS